MIPQVLTLCYLLVAIAADILFGLKVFIADCDLALTYNNQNLGVGTGTPVIFTSHEPLGQYSGLTIDNVDVGYLAITSETVGFVADHAKAAYDLRIKDGIVSYYGLQFYACSRDGSIVIRTEPGVNCEKADLQATQPADRKDIENPEPPVSPPVSPETPTPSPFKNVTIVTITTLTTVTITSCAASIKNCPQIVTTYPVVITTTVGPPPIPGTTVPTPISLTPISRTTTPPVVDTPTQSTTTPPVVDTPIPSTSKPKPNSATQVVSASKGTSTSASVTTANAANVVAMGGVAAIVFGAMLS